MSETIEMKVSGKVKNKEGKACIYVTFEDGFKKAEGELGSGRLTFNSGFTDEEGAALEHYMACHKDEIMKMAKTVNPVKAFLS
jgi:hypothetical protein